MRAFVCPVCERLVTFESSRCLNCSSQLGYDPTSGTMRALQAKGSAHTHRCANAQLAACNWLVGEAGELCSSCALTRTRPNDADGDGLGGFAEAEAAKRRLLFELADLGLPIVGSEQQPGGLAFELLSSERTAAAISLRSPSAARSAARSSSFATIWSQVNGRVANPG